MAMFERFTDEARSVIAVANQEAQWMWHEAISPAHILLGILKLGRGSAFATLQHFGIDRHAAMTRIRQRWEEASWTGRSRIRLMDSSKRALELAMREAQNLNHDYVGTEHVLLGLAALDDPDFATVLSEAGVPNVATLRQELVKTAGE